MTYKFIRRPDLEALLGISRSEIYRRIEQGSLPAPVRIGARSVAWLESEIEQIQSAIVTGAAITDLRPLVERMHLARGYDASATDRQANSPLAQEDAQ